MFIVSGGVPEVGTYIVCAKCKRRIRLPYTSKSEVPLFDVVVCPYCRKLNIVTTSAVEEENVCRVKCPICRTQLYFEIEAEEERIKCPVCNSILRVDTKKCAVEVLRRGAPSVKYKMYWLSIVLSTLENKEKRIPVLLLSELLTQGELKAEKI